MTSHRSLSRREAEIAEFAAQGLSNKQIARHLNIRLDTVKKCLGEVYEKLGVCGRLELMARRRDATSPSDNLSR